MLSPPLLFRLMRLLFIEEILDLTLLIGQSPFRFVSFGLRLRRRLAWGQEHPEHLPDFFGSFTFVFYLFFLVFQHTLVEEVRQSKPTNPTFEQIEIIMGSMQADLRLGCQTIPCCVLEAEFSE